VSAVIGIHDGHNASVALVRNGKVELALQEERFTRVKNQGDAPLSAAALALRLADGTGVRIALNGRYMNYGQWQHDRILRDYERCSALGSRLKQTLKESAADRWYQARKARIRENGLSRLGLDRQQMVPVEHHLAHASAAYHTCPWPDEKVLVLTCDGAGDRLSATVSIGEAGRLTRIAEVSEQDSIGRLYALVTRALGMAPLEHEYKVMGLAAYSSGGSGALKAERMFTELFEMTRHGLAWRRRNGVPPMYAAYDLVKRLVAGQRFDWIAAGVQRFIEQMLVSWARAAVRETGIRKLACAGGVFMNVKANLALLEISEIEDLYVVPSCGDESNSIGAACHVVAQAGDRIQPLGPIYYGDPITDAEAEAALECSGGKLRAHYVPNIERLTAQKVAAGKIVARAAGSVEFGARALGNRSILARADSPNAVRIINQMVKNRDFWMPFAPSVLAERAGDYYDKPKPVFSPYMMFAFRSKLQKRATFAAALHPYDFTTRPQEVTAEYNPSYHLVLKEFESLTGEGILLNTSFNLHGEPIVYRAHDAVDVFLRSGLEHMALGHWWVEKLGT